MALLLLLLVLLLQGRKGSTCTQRKGRKGNDVAGAGARGGVAEEGEGGERDRSRNAHMQGRKALIAHMLLVVVLLLGGQNK